MKQMKAILIMPALDCDKITAITITNPINPPTYRIYLLLSDNKNPTKGKPAQRHAAKPAGLSKLPVTHKVVDI
ncbi:hypothetical protein [Bacteroides caccae]|jgi:hypothetical protein|uniref:hypothetical protein n=2 Tax=Bacteroides caccae TaxID=47678 RepID=UPI001E3CEE41|nr:hypothetical protein [Bacteroides caccae]MDC7129317.1 hypothetical protein [Bacteroides caccae]